MRCMIIRKADRNTDIDGPFAELEIRQVFEIEDFGPNFTPEMRDKDARPRARTATQS